MHLVYDVAHNIAKMEDHTVEGKDQAALCASQGSDPGICSGASGIAWQV